MFRVRTVFTGVQGTPWLSTMYFDESAGTAQNAATAVGAFWAEVDGQLSNLVNWQTEADVSLIDTDTGVLQGVISTSPVNGSGSLSTEALGWVTQGLIRWRTGSIINGRSLRGRTFIPGLTSTGLDDGQMSAIQQGVLNTAASNLISSINATLQIWHRPNPVGSSTGDAGDVLTGTTWPSYAELRTRRD